MSTARTSRSAFGSIEPRNTKAVFAAVRSFALAELVRHHAPVRFVQVGANDGQRGDVLHPFIRAGGWHGLLIEPLPDAFAALCQTYAGMPGLAFANCAIAPVEGQAMFHAVAGAHSVLSSFNRAAILRHAATRPGLEQAISSITVPARRLDTLLPEHNLARPDLLAIDAEGFDDQVLATFPLETARPSIVLFEHVLLDEAPSLALKDRFERAGYALVWDRHEVMALRPGLFAGPLQRLLIDVVEAARRG